VMLLGDDIQESIKTIQRTLDAVFALQGNNGNAHPIHQAPNSTRPSSSASSVQLRLSTVSLLADKLTIGDPYHASPTSVHPVALGAVAPSRSRTPANHGKRYRDEAIATPMVRQHVHFLRRGYVEQYYQRVEESWH
jgi:hypothetical protein